MLGLVQAKGDLEGIADNRWGSDVGSRFPWRV